MWGSVVRSLVCPRESLAAFDASGPRLRSAPKGEWALLVLIAGLGSCLYGGSLSLVLPAWRAARGAAWVAASAGLAWCAFGPALALATRRNPVTLAHACLVTMAYGEGVLAAGAVLNAVARGSGRSGRLPAGRLNLAWVALSNVVMAASLAAQLRAVGVPARLTLALWCVVLDGVGALLFWRLGRRLRRDGAA